MGDPVRGAAAFYARALACSTCHSVGDRPATIGPDLTRVDPKTSDAALVEAVLEPSKTIAAAYATVTVETVDGDPANLRTGVVHAAIERPCAERKATILAIAVC